jgi:hypothetical protein
MTHKLALVFSALLAWNTAQAALSVKVDEPKVTGSKAVIKLTMSSTFTKKVESARAVAFVLDEKGKMLGQSAQWVIGGSKEKPALEPNQSTDFFFVVPMNKPPASTNGVKAKVTFIRLVLEGGQQMDASKQVTVEFTGNPSQEKKRPLGPAEYEE